MNQIKVVEPSLLAFYNSTNFLRILRELKELGVERIHYDVMDGFYVPNFSFTTSFIPVLYQFGFSIEIHLMVKNVVYYYEMFKPYHPTSIVFHPDCLNKKTINYLLADGINQGIQIGLAFNLHVDFHQYESYLPKTKINLIMGVNAGFGVHHISQIGIDKLHAFKCYLTDHNLNLPIIFDGGVNDKTINYIYEDSNYIVSGSYLINSANKKEAYSKLLYNEK